MSSSWCSKCNRKKKECGCKDDCGGCVGPMGPRGPQGPPGAPGAIPRTWEDHADGAILVPEAPAIATLASVTTVGMQSGIVDVHASVSGTGDGNGSIIVFLDVDGVVQQPGSRVLFVGNGPFALPLIFRLQGLVPGARLIRLRASTQGATAMIQAAGAPAPGHASLIVYEIAN